MANQSRRGSKVFRRADSFRPRPEVLEARRLLAVVINEFGGSNTATSPAGITLGPDGNLWFAESNPEAGAIGRITPSGAIENFSDGLAQGATPTGIAAGSDGALWFTDPANDEIGRITTSGVITEFPITTPDANPDQIAAGPDGALWFTERDSDKIGRITTTGIVTEFAIPTANSEPTGITDGPDGALWFTEFGTDKIGRITTGGNITEFAAGISPNSGATGITLGPDGNLWFTETTSGAIARITPEGVVTEYTNSQIQGSAPVGITAGSDGHLWFTEETAGDIGSITTSGTFLNTQTFSGQPLGITSGPDGNLWITAQSGNQIGRLTTSGTLTSFPSADALPASSSPYGIASGPDNALWFTESSANQIGRIDTSGVITQYSTGITTNAGLDSIAEGPANGGTPNLYFTETNANQIGAITTQGVVSEYPISGFGNSPNGITLGPDNNLWITENFVTSGGSRAPASALPPSIISISPTGTLIDDYTLPEQYTFDTANQIATGPDDALWFTLSLSGGGGVIGRVTTKGQFTFYTVPNSPNGTSTSDPIGIVQGFNKDLWFADTGNSAIGEITTAGAITEYSQGLTTSDVPYGITAGPDGNYWFSDPSDNDDPIGRITPQGVITLFQTPTSPAAPMGITTGPDNNIWFVETAAGQIGQAVLPQSITDPRAQPAYIVATVPSSYVVATFTDLSTATNATNFKATIDYGDGTTGPAVIAPVPSSPGTYEVFGSHTFATVGIFVAHITVGTDAGDLPTFTTAILPTSPIAITGMSVDGIAGRRSNTNIASFTDQDISATAADLVGTVTWGDGTKSSAIVRLSGNSGGVSSLFAFAGHVFADAGSFVNTLTVVDSRNGMTASTTFTATVAAAPTFAAINEIGPDTLTPGADPSSITEGPDGALWFTESASGAIGRVDTSGNVTQFLPENSVGGVPGFSPDSDPLGITTGPDGNLWFTEASLDRIARLTPAGVITEFSAGITPGSFPQAIVTGPDGNLWFTETAGNRIARITTSGVVTEYPSILPEGYLPDSITAGPDGNLWFVGYTNMIGRITPQGSMTLYPGASSSVTLGDISEGPDGDLWFTESNNSKVGKINPTTTQVTEYSTPGFATGSRVIAAGPDGALYFAATTLAQIGRITTSGVVTTLTTGLTANQIFEGITAGPDGNVYFSESSGDRIGQIVLPQASITSVAAPPLSLLAGQDFSGTVATFTEASTIPTAENFDAVIDWGDGTSADVVVTMGSDGHFTVSGSHTYAGAGSYTGMIGIFNDAGSKLTPFQIIVTQQPSVTGIPIDVPADRTFTMQVATFGPYGLLSESTPSAIIDWGDGTSSVGSVGVLPDSLTEMGQVVGTHEYPKPGVYDVTTTVEGFGRSVAPATVSAAIFLASPVNIQATAGINFDGVVAGFTDTSLAEGETASDYVASIYWGDGTPATSGTIVLTAGGTLEVTGNHVYANVGDYPLTVLIAKPATGDTASASGTARVTAATPPLSFVVTNTNDSGAGSLRQAIIDADTVGGHAITFAIPSPGVSTIDVLSPLPTITGPTVIDGRTQAVFEGVTTLSPLVEIDGQGGSAVDGLTFMGGLTASGSGLAGLSIFGFPGAQVAIDAISVGLIDNYVGLRADGTVPLPVGGGAPSASFASAGVRVSALDAIIGGPGPGDGNVISGNDGYGIVLEGNYFGDASIVGNRIGLDPTGQAARPNLLDGIAVMNGAGYENIGPGNTISGNAGNGINLLGTVADMIEGNDIGTNAGATRAIGNGDYGVAVYGSSIQITGNVISGNAVVGVGITGGSMGDRLESNLIGTDGTGDAAIGNGIAGVLISDSPNNVVGPDNLVSGNGTSSPGAGIWIDGPAADSNQVFANKVGTDITGSFAIPNSEIGVLINQGSDNVIGDYVAGNGNLISGNTSVGLMIAGPGASANLVAANLIGTNAGGSSAIGNGSSTQGAGVYIDNASGNSIGGPISPGNLISGNKFDGVQIFGPSSSGNVFQGNRVGTNLAGTARLGNAQDGLLINGAPGTQVLGNLVAANGLDGITVSGPGSTDTLIEGNTIGRGVGGQPLGNGTFGLLVINGAPLPTQINNVSVNNTDGPIRDTGTTTSGATSTASAKAKEKKVAVIHGKAKPSSPTKLHPKAKAASKKPKK